MAAFSGSPVGDIGPLRDALHDRARPARHPGGRHRANQGCTARPSDIALSTRYRSVYPSGSALLITTFPDIRWLARQRVAHCTRYVALHPLRHTAPVTSRCTRSERVQCLRIGCNASPSSAIPLHNKPKRGSLVAAPMWRAPEGCKAWLRCPWAVAGPGRASSRRAEAHISNWPHWCGGRRRDRRARVGFEARRRTK